MLIGDYHEKQWLLSLTSGREGVRLDMFFIYCARKATHYVYIYVLGSLGDIIFNYEGTKISSFSSSPWISPINSIRFRQHPEGKKWRKNYDYIFSNENVSSVTNFILYVVNRSRDFIFHQTLQSFNSIRQKSTNLQNYFYSGKKEIIFASFS